MVPYSNGTRSKMQINLRDIDSILYLAQRLKRLMTSYLHKHFKACFLFYYFLNIFVIQGRNCLSYVGAIPFRVFRCPYPLQLWSRGAQNDATSTAANGAPGLEISDVTVRTEWVWSLNYPFPAKSGLYSRKMGYNDNEQCLYGSLCYTVDLSIGGLMDLWEKFISGCQTSIFFQEQYMHLEQKWD